MIPVQMNPLRRALIGLGAAGVALGSLMAVVIATSDHTNLKALLTVLSVFVAASFIGTGLYAWDRRPDNLIGPLMVALGFAWCLSQLSTSNVPALFAAGHVLESLPFAILIHLLLAFPGGRLEDPLDRFLAASAYVLTLGFSCLTVWLWDPAVADLCGDCPDNPLLVWREQGLLDVVLFVQNTLSVTAIAVLVWRLLRRRRAQADPSERLRNSPVFWAGAATLTLVFALLLTGLGPEEGSLDDYVNAAALALLGTVPFAFLLGILRSRLWQADVVAVENVRLDAELQARLDELRESRARIVEAGYAERRRVERDLHDGAQQRLVAVGLDLRRVRSALERNPADAVELLEAASRELAAATDELRELARGIHPPVLTDRGLVAALESLAARAPLPVAIEADGEARAPEAVEAAAYFVVSEALTNVARYAQAGEAVVRVHPRPGELVVEVADDGVGGADVGAGTGLRGLADRVGALGGRLDVDSERGRGTVVRASLPLRR